MYNILGGSKMFVYFTNRPWIFFLNDVKRFGYILNRILM